MTSKPTRQQAGEHIALAVAHRVFILAPDLNDGDKRVAAVILGHRNRLTARCDPGVTRISLLSGLSERTVKRSIKALGASSIFIVNRHGGLSQRNSYTLNIPEILRRDQVWKGRKSNASRERAVTNLAPEGRQECPQTGDADGTQTYPLNSSELTSLEIFGDGAVTLQKASSLFDPNSRSKSSLPSFRALGRTSPGFTGSGNPAGYAAEYRWDRDLREHFLGNVEAYQNAIEMIDVTASDGATEREVKRRGAGLVYLLEEIERKGISRKGFASEAGGPIKATNGGADA